MIDDQASALRAIDKAWPQICAECLAVLGSELHYQAMVYHALRTAGGVPLGQLGMNVKQWIPDVKSELFKALDLRKHQNFRGGFEPIPDVVIFSDEVGGDWRRRRGDHTISCMLAVMEIKASERSGSRLSRQEVFNDIRKLAAHREEARFLGYDFELIMLVIDSASDERERMSAAHVKEARELSRTLNVEWRYISPVGCHVDRPARPGETSA